jgi:hypothetical protein
MIFCKILQKKSQRMSEGDIDHITIPSNDIIFLTIENHIIMTRILTRLGIKKLRSF